MITTTSQKKVYQCAYCDKILSNYQALYRHKRTTKKCIALQKEMEMKCLEPAVDVQLPTSNKKSESLAKIMEYSNDIKALLAKIEELKIDVDAEDFKMSTSTLYDNVLISRNITPVKQYNLKDDHDTLLHFGDHLDDVRHLVEYIHKSYDMVCFRKGQIGIAYGIYSFFFPKFIRCTDTTRKTFKYKNNKGEIVVDNNLDYLVNLVHMYVYDRASELYPIAINDAMDHDTENKIHHMYMTDIMGFKSNSMLFLSQICRLIDTSDGVEFRKTLAKSYDTIM